MMNLLSLSLVLTSLAALGVLSNQRESTIIKDGHRVIVVEYDQEGHQNTRIKISPETYDEKLVSLESAGLDNAKEKIKEAASVFPNKGQDNSGEPNGRPFLHTPKELICDAYGKCKEKIAGAMEKATEKVSETAHAGIEKKIEIAHEINARQKETAREVGHTAADAVGKARETASHAAQSVKETTKESVEKAKDTLHDAVDKSRTFRNDFRGNVSNEVLKVIRGAKHLLTMQMLNSMMDVFNLMGFSTAYGLCVWITFISSYVLSKAMPRQQFGVVQSKIYPVYFRAMAYSIGLALLGHVLSHSKRLYTSLPERLQVLNLLGSLLTVSVNSVYLEPRATKVMFERMKIEKEEGRGREDIASERSREGREHHQAAGQTESIRETGTATATAEAATSPEQYAGRSRILRLNDKLKKLNSYSSFLNILTLISLTWHLVYLAQRLQLCPSSM